MPTIAFMPFIFFGFMPLCNIIIYKLKLRGSSFHFKYEKNFLTDWCFDYKIRLNFEKMESG